MVQDVSVDDFGYLVIGEETFLRADIQEEMPSGDDLVQTEASHYTDDFSPKGLLEESGKGLVNELKVERHTKDVKI